jgi:hypothetical protein
MKIIRFYILAICILFLCISEGKAQSSRDTIARHYVTYPYLVSTDTLRFGIEILRDNDVWTNWSNGTFQLEFLNNTIELNDALYGIEYIGGTSELSISPFTGQIPEDTYYITPRIFSQRISITIAGPDYYVDSDYINLNDTTVLGEFYLFTLDGSPIPDIQNLQWKKPIDYYQASAYKTPDAIIEAGATFYESDDNVEFDNYRSTTALYANKDIDLPKMILDTMWVDYAGVKKVIISWATEQEAFNQGFILKRAFRAFGEDENTLTYDHLVARYGDGSEAEQRLKGLGTSPTGAEYFWKYDTVEYRGVDYCYLLQYQHFDGTIYDLAIRCLEIPNAVITLAKPKPNPFEVSTTIEYRVDDDVYMTAKAYDMQGKLVHTFMENQYVNVGLHDLQWTPGNLAQQGFYDIIFIAYPVDDPSIERSQTTVKVQFFRK